MSIDLDFSAFSIAQLPRIEFGNGITGKLPDWMLDYGNKVLLITGNRSIAGNPIWHKLISDMADKRIKWQRAQIHDEPSPELIDEIVHQYHTDHIDVIVGIGGGSVLDAAKAIAGLLPSGNSVMDHLEGVGPELPYEGQPTPFIAVPTTAGTGSEATKNAVLSRRGEDGFKKSFRDNQLVPDMAVLDPELLATCPPPLIAANGMDALTQLMESYVSLGANPFTDALALSGLEATRDSLLPWYQDSDNRDARSGMAYAALLSGITLAQCGLGSVHGLASPLGAFFPIPHGVVCGTLVAKCTAKNIEAMNEREPDNIALDRYARLGNLFTHQHHPDNNSANAALVSLLENWTQTMALPPLSEYGITEGDFDRIIANCRGSSMKTNPVVLTDTEISDILYQRL
jgi:alcohol dehydrogenase